MPIFGIFLSYLIFCKFIGPKLMRNKKSMELTNTMMAYNLFQIFMSTWLFYLSRDCFQVYFSFKSRFTYIDSHPHYVSIFNIFCLFAEQEFYTK